MAPTDDPPTQTEQIQGALLATLSAATDLAEMELTLRSTVTLRKMLQASIEMIDKLENEELENHSAITA